jgi:hypothetical protein
VLVIHNKSVRSDESLFPLLSTTTSLSASISNANPNSSFLDKTSFLSSKRSSVVGSGDLDEMPSISFIE